jgi:hypothetical protein
MELGVGGVSGTETGTELSVKLASIWKTNRNVLTAL